LFGQSQRNFWSGINLLDVGFLICLTLSMLLLYSNAELPIGTAYAWTEGAVGTVLVGIVVKEPATFLENLLLTTLIASIMIKVCFSIKDLF
jgi:multidrug transporter EmrE-like cation transporter